MAVVRRADASTEWIVGPREVGFGSCTEALGGGGTWQTLTLQWRAGDIVVLATDGVADDLLEDRVGDFAHWLVDGFATLSPHRRWTALARELRSWPTPRHIDDKTVAVLAVLPEKSA